MKILDNSGQEYEIVDYINTPPSEEELKSLTDLEEKTKGQSDRIIQIKTKLADLTMQQNDISFKK